MRSLTVLGVILALLGIIGLATPIFFTQHTENVAEVGPLKLQRQTNEAHVVPPVLSGGVLALGVVLIGVGAFSGRQRL